MRTSLSDDEVVFIKKLGERLAALRKERGLTQTQLAELVGLTQPRLLSFEKGRRRMPVSSLPAFAKALGVSLEELLGVETKPTKRGPSSRLEQQLELATQLPRSQQRIISRVLDGLLQQAV